MLIAHTPTHYDLISLISLIMMELIDFIISTEIKGPNMDPKQQNINISHLLFENVSFYFIKNIKLLFLFHILH